MGDAHGRAHAEEIRRYTRDRVDLVAGGLWSGGPLERGAVLELAAACLSAHEAFSPGLHAEMLAMAGAAGITPAEAVVVGGFTDFVDTVRAASGDVHPPEMVEDDCTAFVVPDSRADGAGFLGQTWDMHDAATDHVVLARLRPDAGPDALVFTTVGCLGQIGMNAEGVCVGINNLTGNDGRFGVTWPTVIRDMLAQATAAGALDVLMRADLAGAHNYLILDAEGRGFNVEAMPSARPVQTLRDEPLAHTNHVTDPVAEAYEGEFDAEIMVNSRHRLELAETMLADNDKPVDPECLMEVTREPTAICRSPDVKFRVETSGAVIMRPRTGDFWACWGQPSDNRYEHFSLAPAATRSA
jgi:isopenicillin-N N-acyltransferase-like protein